MSVWGIKPAHVLTLLCLCVCSANNFRDDRSGTWRFRHHALTWVPTFFPVALLSEYFDAVRASGTSWPVRNSTDFFPYSPGGPQYWTGFFTSRPALKGWIRSREAVTRAAEVLYVVSHTPWGSRADALDEARLHVFRAANGEVGTTL